MRTVQVHVPSKQSLYEMGRLLTHDRHKMSQVQDQAFNRAPNVIQPPPPARAGILTADIDPLGTGEATRYIGEAGSEQSLDSVTVTDWFGCGGTSGDRVLIFRSPYAKGQTLYFTPDPRPSFSSITRNLTSGGGAFTTTSGTLTAITFNLAGAQSGCTANTTSHHITVDRAGKYVVEHGASAYALSDSLAAATIEVHKNGTYIDVGRMALSVSAVANDAGYTWKHTLTLAAGDIITVKAGVSGGGSYSLTIENPWLYVERKGA